MAKNLVEALGRDYFNERYRRALLVQNGAVLGVESAGREVVTCITVVSADKQVSKKQEQVNIPYSVFTGFEVFKSPELGYRKIKDGCYYMRAVLSRSYASAFFADRVQLNASRATRYLQNLGELTPPRNVDGDTIAQLYYPTYDTLDNWESLINGDYNSLVLSSRVAIEPSTRLDDDAYDVLFDNVLIGSVDPAKKVRKNTPAFNTQMINRILKQ